MVGLRNRPESEMGQKARNGFDPSRGGGGRNRPSRGAPREAGGFVLAFALFVAVVTAILWIADRPTWPGQRGAESAPEAGIGSS